MKLPPCTSNSDDSSEVSDLSVAVPSSSLDAADSDDESAASDLTLTVLPRFAARPVMKT